MAKFSVPSSPARNVLAIDTFVGADFTNSPANVSESQSPNCQNMIRDVPGKVRKCMGYHTIRNYGAKINGFHYVYGSEDGLIHAGTDLYKGGEVIYSGMNDARSMSWQFDSKVYIADGKALLVYDGNSVSAVTDEAYIPVITIAKAPGGGGTSYEALNLIQPGFTELFQGTEADVKYQLTFGELDDTTVEVSLLNENGEWIPKSEITDFTVDRVSGTISFLSAPGKSPITGEDNVKITAYRTVEGYADRINKCTIGIQYGVNGALDRLFLGGNPDYINYDWYSGQNNVGYWPDIGYSTIGSSRSKLVGYSIINNYLAAHKDEMEKDHAIILRAGTLTEDGEPAFKIVDTLHGEGAIAKYTFAYLKTEPLYLSRSGILAVTTPDSGEKYSQNRSYYLDGKLLKESNLEEAYSCVFDDMYWLCVNGVAYILDGLQSLQTSRSEPYSTRQYAGFYRTNLPANVMWVHQNKLLFGTVDGRVCEFYTNKEAQSSYNDDGVAIEAIWETPDLDGKLFYKNKTFRYMAVRLQAAIATSVSIWVQKRGIWSFLKKDDSTGRYLNFANIIFSKFSFSTDTTQRVIPTKLRVKKVDKARFRLVNRELNEPFGIYDVAFEYVENGNVK